MPIDFVTLANVIISGVLTGLVYGLMALALSVIFGVARVVNFAHGEMMTLAMYTSVILFSTFGLNPFIAVIPVAAIFFVFGYGTPSPRATKATTGVRPRSPSPDRTCG